MGIIPRIAWRNVGRHRRRSAITVTAMAVGVAMSLAMISLSDGMYLQMFDSLVRQDLGHVQLHAPAYPKKRALYETIDEADAVVAEVEAVEGVAGVTARVHGFALLAAGEEATGGQITGVRPDREAKVTLVHDRMTKGRYLEGEGEIILGSGLAETLEADLGSEIVAVTQAADGSLGNALYEVVGVFKTGAAQLDRASAFVRLSDAQSLLALEGRIHEIAVLAEDTDPAAIDVVAGRVQDALERREVLVRTWRQIDPVSAQLIATQDVSIGILLIIVFAVAALGVLNTMLMSVFERLKELGVLQALGVEPRQIVGLVLWESSYLAILSALLGGLAGLGLSVWLELSGLDLSRFTEGFSFSGVAFDPVLRGDLRVDRLVSVVVALFVVAILASIWPALRAARLNPVEAMRQE